MFVVFFSWLDFFAEKGGLGPEQAGAGRSKPERPGAPGALKKSSQLLEFRLKAKRARGREH